ncbi:MAG: hydrogenase iron-sulfur subunit [Chloroflexota bacterium]
MSEFRPRILAFLCNWCSYAGADLAGVSRIQYPPDTRVVRVMCSGRVDPVIVVRAFRAAIDGVMVLGCHPGDCHYGAGNYEAERKANLLNRVLDKTGIGRQRLCLEWVSAAEGGRFAELTKRFSEQITALGPIGQTDNLDEKLFIARRMVENVQLRWLVGRESGLAAKGNVYGERIRQEEIDELTDRNIENLYVMSRILLQIKDNPLSIREIATKANLPVGEVFRYVVKMEDGELATFVDFKDRSPRYLAVAGDGKK